MFSRRSSAAEPEPQKKGSREEDEDTPTKELRSYFAQLRAKSGLPGLDKSKNFLEKSKTFQRYGLYAIALIIALLVGAATYARVRTDNIRSKKRERKRLKGEWCDDGEINLKRCTTLDLTLKAEPLGDDGIKDLVKRLHGKQFARKEKRRLRNLIIQHHGISNEGARRLAQLIASCANPLHQLSSPCAFDTSKRFELDLRANPIGKRGVEQIRAAVERAKSFGFPVIVWVGGHSEVRAAGGPRIKVGAIEVQLGKTSSPVWKSKFYGAFVLNHRAVLHAIDATPARWRGDLVHPTHWLISTGRRKPRRKTGSTACLPQLWTDSYHMMRPRR